MQSDKRAMLGMPTYGEISSRASRAFWKATQTPDQLYRCEQEGSLLAANFNTLWCNALNHKFVGGNQLDYFAMQHSDVGAEDWWLDTMIEEMERHDLDVLSAVIPIKDSRGLTSTALDRPDGDPFRPLCRLSMAELFRLPETFTSEDTGHPLLINTGLWVCRFDESWVKRITFTVQDAIIWDKGLNQYIAKCAPEDWTFSRKLNQIGLRVGATRKIKIAHRGPAELHNAAPWGKLAFDSEWHPQGSLIPEDGFQFPHDVEGWLRFNEGKALFDLARGKRVLEIGSYCGKSTICLAQTAKQVVSVDPHDGRGTPAPKDTLETLKGNLARYNVHDKVTLQMSTASTFAHQPKLMGYDDQFDLIFIDGAHDYDSVQSDIESVLPLLADDGLLVFHDYRSPIDPGVTAAVDDFLSAGAELVSTHSSLAVVRPPALVEAA